MASDVSDTSSKPASPLGSIQSESECSTCETENGTQGKVQGFVHNGTVYYSIPGQFVYPPNNQMVAVQTHMCPPSIAFQTGYPVLSINPGIPAPIYMTSHNALPQLSTAPLEQQQHNSPVLTQATPTNTQRPTETSDTQRALMPPPQTQVAVTQTQVMPVYSQVMPTHAPVIPTHAQVMPTPPHMMPSNTHMIAPYAHGSVPNTHMMSAHMISMQQAVPNGQIMSVQTPVMSTQVAAPLPQCCLQPASPQYEVNYCPSTPDSTDSSHGYQTDQDGISISQRLEEVWFREFKKNFSKFPIQWELSPTVAIPPIPMPGAELDFDVPDMEKHTDSAKVRFICPECNHCWTSMKGRVGFGYVLDTKRNSGLVVFKLYGQKCQKCEEKKGSADELEFVHAMWYKEEIEKVIYNLCQMVGKTYYGYERPTVNISRRKGCPKKQHNRSVCQACQENICKEERNFARQA